MLGIYSSSLGLGFFTLKLFWKIKNFQVYFIDLCEHPKIMLTKLRVCIRHSINADSFFPVCLSLAHSSTAWGWHFDFFPYCHIVFSYNFIHKCILVIHVFQAMAAQVRTQDYGKPFLSNYLLNVPKHHLYDCSCQFFKASLHIHRPILQ